VSLGALLIVLGLEMGEAMQYIPWLRVR